MRLGDLYRAAAAKVNRARRRVFLYKVIGGSRDYGRAEAMFFWRDVFAAGVADDEWTNERRVFALLFAAAIADSEGL